MANIVNLPNKVSPQTSVNTLTNTSPWSAKTLLVAGLLLILMLMLASSYPKYVLGFMLLLLLSVSLAHSNVLTSLLSIGA